MDTSYDIKLAEVSMLALELFRSNDKTLGEIIRIPDSSFGRTEVSPENINENIRRVLAYDVRMKLSQAYPRAIFDVDQFYQVYPAEEGYIISVRAIQSARGCCW